MRSYPCPLTYCFMHTFLFSLFVPLMMIAPADGADCPRTNASELNCTYNAPEYTSKETLTAGLNDLPFHLELPLLWTMQDSRKAYYFLFDSGQHGLVRLAKTPTSEKNLDLPASTSPLAVFCRGLDCWIYGKSLQGVYLAHIEDRGGEGAMEPRHKAQALKLIKSAALDL